MQAAQAADPPSGRPPLAPSPFQAAPVRAMVGIHVGRQAPRRRSETVARPMSASISPRRQQSRPMDTAGVTMRAARARQTRSCCVLMIGMSRHASPDGQTLADLLALPVVELRCHGCGRRRRMDPDPLFEQLKHCDWITPLHEAARALRCGRCGQREAEIVIPGARAQPRLQLVPPVPLGGPAR